MATASKPSPSGQKQVTHLDKLEDQAATAALYATGQNRQKIKSGQDYLDNDHKLSSAGAAASLKYANPQDLPSYPSAGLKNNDNSAAGAAASSGWANQKPFEHWKPDASASASAAAMQAKDYKMAPMWKPEQSANGAKAALLAHNGRGKVDIWQPEADSPWGNSAASQAFKKFGAGTLSPQLDYGYTSLGRQRSLIAANGAMSSGRKRANTTPSKVPETYPDEGNATQNALSAATSAHRQKKPAEVSPTGGSSPFTNMPREMFTSHPPVKPEVDEKNRQDTLHASAVAMAQGMYKQQQKSIEATTTSMSHRGAKAAHGRSASISTVDSVEPMRFDSLQEAAHKLAQERLARLHDEHSKNREYRDYYGNNSQPKSRMSVRGRTRRRASSDGMLDEDKEQSTKIRAQMSMFTQNVTQIDEKKRKQDREALIAAAQRNVTKQLHGMDEKMFAETGHVAPSLLNEWELKAHAAAQKKSESRMENFGRVDIGGGKFVNQSAVNLAAARNVQPVLDEINRKAEAERERQAVVKDEKDLQAQKAAEKKAGERKSKDSAKKLKQQAKEEESTRRADEKAAKKEEERLVKEKRKSLKVGEQKSEEKITEPIATSPTTVTQTESEETEPVVSEPSTTTAATSVEPVTQPGSTIAARRDVAVAPIPTRTSMEDQMSLRMQERADAANPDEATFMSPEKSPKSGNVKNWLKSKFASKRSSKIAEKSDRTSLKQSPKDEKFTGGAALTGATSTASAASSGEKNASIKDVALAGKEKDGEKETTAPVIPLGIIDKSPLEAESSNAAESETAKPVTTTDKLKVWASTFDTEDESSRPKSRASTVSALSDDDDDEFLEAKDHFDNELTVPQPKFVAQKSHSPARESKFIENVE
ncbi:hypothetical protein BJ878DRAFT_518577 [Calycina marina]|uniref:Eisosome protein 1 n=1 Tax=Calycina marina TaxID=1763456 RepID=A0A9P7YY41_9HELO|nr:hypothetical protein BJ878DRAFT_518577 [Calycina marina]